ncbi:hypothetical protein KC19_VG182900 [Ceratodon purpureus]|uniref:TF-B3 domain-containing protein n=2 Tax=Ceratodon purpureus TaxID=3225 RepID=A0A8T0HRB3_CERPU|nr:hypothetical protein KC19_VG182900 [Ceratodon purpureus]
MAHLFTEVVKEMDKEIPVAFTNKTKWPGEKQCALVTSMSSKQWQVNFERRNSSFVSTGTGWRDFLCDQELRIGNILVFEVVDERCLVVTINPYAEKTPFKKILRPTHLRENNSARLLSVLTFQPNFGVKWGRKSSTQSSILCVDGTQR